jgi:S-formylglutathione hydrolase FrmB
MCEKSTFCTAATNKTFILVRPEMGKSIYASSIYPETRKDWSSYPQLKFITDTLIPELQAKFSLLKPGQNNFLYGISTGARGVAMIALHTGKLFKAGAALSGDYEQTRMPKDNLMKGYYGELDKFKERWQKDDPYLHAAEIKIPLYLAHGGSDKVVPTEQTKIFFKKLKEVSPALKHELHIADSAGHNYDFWGKETDEVLKFFFAHDK